MSVLKTMDLVEEEVLQIRWVKTFSLLFYENRGRSLRFFKHCFLVALQHLIICHYSRMVSVSVMLWPLQILISQCS